MSQRRIEKTEGRFKHKLKADIEHALPKFFVLPHIDSLNGTPDWSVSGNGLTSWLEFKHATPAFTSRGIQVLTARKLAAAGQCRYVVFWENASERRTCIVHPHNVSFGSNPTIAPELFCEGYSNEFVIGYIKKVHGLYE